MVFRARCKLTAICLSALLAVSAHGSQLQNRFFELGPNPILDTNTGRVSSIACSKTNPNIVYIGAADGGVWKTSNAGTSWTPLTDQMPTLAIGAVAVQSNNDDIVYAGTGEANFANHSRYGLGIYKTIDGGSTWTTLGSNVFSGRCISRILIDPSNSSTLYASVTPAGGFPERAAAKGHPDRNGPLGVFKSIDAGVSWTRLTGLPNESATDIAIDAQNPNVLYAAIGRIFGSPSNGIYKSTDAGTSWNLLSGGLPSANIGRISLTCNPQNSNRVYALVTNVSDAFGGGASLLGIYKSVDAGMTWTPLSSGLSQATYGWYLSTINSLPSNPDTIVAGGLTCRRTTNGGTTWSTITPPHVDLHALEWDAAGNLWCGNDGGVHFSSNLGSSWTAKNAGLGVIQFYAGLSTSPQSPNVVFGGKQDNGSSIKDAQDNWTHVLGGDGGWTQIDPTNSLRMFGESQGTGNIFRTVNGGTTFNTSNTGIVGTDRNCFMPPYVIDPTNPNRMLYGTHRVYQSTNGGVNWTPISGDVTTGSGAIRSLAISPSNGQRVYLTTNDGLVKASNDGGSTFSLVRSGHPGWPRVMREIFIHPTNPDSVYLAASTFGTQRLLHTSNGGASWADLSANLPNSPVNTVCADARFAPPHIYAGLDDGLYFSSDHAATWSRLPLPRAAIIDLVPEFSRGRLTVGTQGRGAWVWRIPTPIVPGLR